MSPKTCITLRLQLSSQDNLSSLQALLKALDDLENLCDAIGEAYAESLQNDDYEKWDEKSWKSRPEEGLSYCLLYWYLFP